MPFLLRLITLLLATVVTSSSPSAPPSNAAGKPFRSNPYEILGVPITATQKEIQQQYRSLCLLHHPDKKRKRNVNESKPGVENDFAFKEIQHAYSLIGTEEDRRKYDMASKWNRFSAKMQEDDGFVPNGNHFASSESFGSSIYFTFGRNGPSFKVYHRPTRQRGYYATPFHFHSPYSANGNNAFHDVTPSTRRAHYVQNVLVPLEVLYAGGEVDFTLSSSIIDRYRAAYRGGLLTTIITQAALTVIMTWLRSQKISCLLSLFLFATIVHLNIPPLPTKRVYQTRIEPGWKAGTKVKYKATEPDCVSDVTFVIQEGRHDVFERVGNDMQATISVKARRLRRGCTVYIDSLVPKQEPIKLKLKPGEITEDGQIVVIKGRGWPKHGDSNECEKDFGDLLVKVRIKI
ncbi:hypothetical protein ACHAW6_014146 [Cyclotella cf. meneghiniana]